MFTSPSLLPQDPHDQTLAANVHPQDWMNPEPSGRYNLVVLGGGTAGLVCAAGAAGLGAKVALIERHLLGGDCLNTGCVPSKALIRASRALFDARHSAEFGLRGGETSTVDFPAAMERMRRLRAGISRHDSARRFRDELGVEVFLGQGQLTGPDRIEVNGRELLFDRAALCTGARAAVPDIPGLAEADYLTNETVFTLQHLPPRMAVIGGGPIGCELAQAFARLGSQVSLLHHGRHLLNREDEDAAHLLQSVLLREGITLHLGVALQQVERQGQETRLHFDAEGTARQLTVDTLLVAVGRAPNIEGLGLERAGVAASRTGVQVDDRLQTTNPRIYAAGDICSAYKFTHTADAQARLLLANALFKGRQKMSRLVVPWCTNTDPEIAHVGLSVREAQAQAIPITTLSLPLSSVDRALLDGETEGFAKVHLRKGTDTLLGATIVARHAGEMISELSLAITNGLGLSAISRTIHPYPTQAEVIKKLADAHNRTRLTRTVKTLLSGWLWWRRR